MLRTGFSTVTLLKQHTHAGVIYKPGESISVCQVVANWLKENQIGGVAAKSTKKGKKDE